MKKLTSILMAVVLTVALLTSCGTNSADDKALSAKELLKKTSEAQMNVQSVSFDADLMAKIGIVSEGIEMNMDFSADMSGGMSLKDKLCHVIMNLSAMGEQINSEMYFDYGVPFTMYSNTDGTWYKEQMDEEAAKELEEALQKSLALEMDFDSYMTSLSHTEGEYNGREIYDIKGEISVEKALEKTKESYPELIQELEEELEVPKGFFDEWINKIGNIPLQMGVEKDTYYLAYMKIDMTDAGNRLVSGIIDTLKEVYGEEGEVQFKLDECVINCEYRDYNKTEISIPDEALGAEDMDEYDEYDDYEFYDEYYDEEYYF